MRRVSRSDVGYDIPLEKIPAAGVYVFGRQWGNGFEALYSIMSIEMER